MKQLFGLAIALMITSGCRVLDKPRQPFDRAAVPASPDYSHYDHWSALPFKADMADTVPDGYNLVNRQDTAAVDVFFIHPTTYKQSGWNAPLHDERTNAATAEGPILHQSTVFNGTARVFAPRYRQLTYWGFFSNDSISMREAIKVAYGDVLAAFRYYLRHWNDGRPFFLAGHSQGARHGQQLLGEVFRIDSLRKLLVAAYLPGWKVAQCFAEQVPLCLDATDVGCFVTWSTYAKDKWPRRRAGNYYSDAVCVNPINWKPDARPSSLDEHQGVLNGKYNHISKPLLKAACEDGILQITTDDLPFPYNWARNFHVADFNLFWRNIRENVAVRWYHYQSKRPGSTAE